MAEKNYKDYLKKVDMSDIKVLGVGMVLLVIPVFFLFLLTQSTGGKKVSHERMKTMVDRKNLFNYNTASQKTGDSPARPKAAKKSGWLTGTESPERVIQQELEQAMSLVRRSKPAESFPPGMTEMQKEAYRGEHNPLVIEGNAYLDAGNFVMAEKVFLEAFDDGSSNTFQQVYAMGGLMEVYEKMGDQAKYQAAFEKFMELLAKLPPEYGGGNLRQSVSATHAMLKNVMSHADAGKVAQHALKDPVVREGHYSVGQIPDGIGQFLQSYPFNPDR